MDLSIVIVNWNGLAVLRNCLDSLFNRDQGVSFEVILVDNASQDESVPMVERDFPQVSVLRNAENRGFAAANNQGFKIARGRYLLLLNNDTVVLGDALASAVQFLERTPDVGALGCRVVNPDHSFQTSCFRFNDARVLAAYRLFPIGGMLQERFNYGRYWARQFSQPTDVDAVAGCFLVVRREVINKVGALDEDFFMYGEEEEWCSRIKGAGWRIVYFPGATIIHLHRFSSKRARKALRIIECLSPMLVVHKRCGFGAAWRANFVLLVAYLLRLPFWLAIDCFHLLKGNARLDLIHARFSGVRIHLLGLVTPVWLPPPVVAGTAQ